MIKSISKTKHQVRIFHKGKQVGMKTFRRLTDAKRWETDQKKMLNDGQWTDFRRGEVSLGAVIEDFNATRLGTISQHAYDTDEANLRLHVSDETKRRSINTIEAVDIEVLLGIVIRKRARATASRVRDSLVSVFKYAKARKLVSENPAKEAELPKGLGQEISKVRPFTSAELEGLIAHARTVNAEYANLVEFAALTGLRWGELVELRVRDLGYVLQPVIIVERSKSDAYEVGSTKSRRERRVPLIDRAEVIVAEQIAGKGSDDLMFQAPRGGRVNGGNFRRQLGWTKNAHGHRPHDLRHTAATVWISSGLDVKVVSTWLGHSTSAITHSVYAGWLGADSDVAAIAKLRAANAAKTPLGAQADDESE